MPTLIMSKLEGNIDGSIKAKAMTFLQRLSEDDRTPGLHIEPIIHAADPRVRTGRVDQFWRAVLFRLDGGGEAHYVVHGVWPHDKAIKIAERVRLRVNPVNGLPQFEQELDDAVPVALASVRNPWPLKEGAPAEPVLVAWGRKRTDLVDRLGVPEDVADIALAAPDEDALLALAERHEGWLGLLLVDLATGDSVESLIDRLQLIEPASTESDSDLLGSLQQPAARAQFAFVDGQDELRRVIETEDFGAWRIFLHPEQLKYVEKTYSGPFRLSGGAGTGKTVVLVHRARRLARDDAERRIVLCTFTTNLAASLRRQLAELDPALEQTEGLGGAGVTVVSIDSLAAAVIRNARGPIDSAVVSVLGGLRAGVNNRTSSNRWRSVLDSVQTDLPPEIANETFLTSEYSLIVLPNRVRDETGYLRVRRPGRGVALDRSRRSAVWALIRAYRDRGQVDGSLDYAEAAAVAAAFLEANPAERPADHVLVDEAQDLAPPQLQLIRALVMSGEDDLFIAEDSHQRIYGPRVVLGRYGIRIVGRSHRLTLNYRTTAQNLRYAISMLGGGHVVDLEDQDESMGYRSARSGPQPRVADVAGLDDELDRIVAQVEDWLSDGAEPATLAVLVQDRFQRDRIALRLCGSGVPAQSVGKETPVADQVTVMTMHRAKGMEFRKVILADVGYISAAQRARLSRLDPSERADAELRRRSLEYVAASRARDELVVFRRK